jgi:hypothetical protein
MPLLLMEQEKEAIALISSLAPLRQRVLGVAADFWMGYR